MRGKSRASPGFFYAECFGAVRPPRRQHRCLGALPPAPRKAEENLEGVHLCKLRLLVRSAEGFSTADGFERFPPALRAAPVGGKRQERKISLEALLGLAYRLRGADLRKEVMPME